MGALVILPFLTWVAAAQPVERIICPEGPYHIAPFSLSVDDSVRTLETSGVAAEPETVKITHATVEFSFMRGWAVFHRDTRVLEWDATAQYDHNSAIGYPGPHPRAWYAGTARCEVK